jgi:hypothetical protein
MVPAVARRDGWRVARSLIPPPIGHEMAAAATTSMSNNDPARTALAMMAWRHSPA